MRLWRIGATIYAGTGIGFIAAGVLSHPGPIFIVGVVSGMLLMDFFDD